MKGSDGVQIVLFLVLLLVLVKPLGAYLARVFEGDRVWLSRVLGPVERGLYWVLGVKRTADGTAWEEMDWKRYVYALLWFQAVCLVGLYALLRLQGHLPWNPQGRVGMPAWLAFNTAVSFVTNTNWQAYSGEQALSHGAQMLGLTVQNFVSAATGLAVLVALIRGLVRRSVQTVGNFWVDCVRGVLYVLLPLAVVVALVLVSQGVVQTMLASKTVSWWQTGTPGQQVIALGPVASQVAIKQLGTNGGGFFNANGAHPFENPTALSNLLQLLCIVLLPASLCYTFGRMVRDTRQGWTVLAAMGLVFVGVLTLGLWAEHRVPADYARLGVETQAMGNLEGKEVRFGVAQSVLWATTTTAASNGSVNAMHDSFTPLGGLGPLWLMQLGEVVFGGVGSGLYGMLVFALLAVFVAGLLVGRTPEYLGKKIEAFEIQMAALVVLLPSAACLLATAVAVLLPSARASILNPGAHGFTEVLYAFSSAANNNGSAFAGLNADTPFYHIATALCMLVGRYGVMIPVLALAGALARKKVVPAGAGTLPTHTGLFLVLLIGVVVLVGALTFLPALALGPLAEHGVLYK